MALATEEQVNELANTIALQATAFAEGQVACRYAASRLLLNNAMTLAQWTIDDRK